MDPSGWAALVTAVAGGAAVVIAAWSRARRADRGMAREARRREAPPAEVAKGEATAAAAPATTSIEGQELAAIWAAIFELRERQARLELRQTELEAMDKVLAYDIKEARRSRPGG